MSQATSAVLASRPVRPAASTAVAASDAANTTQMWGKPAIAAAAASACGRPMAYVSVRVGLRGSRKNGQGCWPGGGCRLRGNGSRGTAIARQRSRSTQPACL
ncbi:hypothetical protein MTO96_050565 [Rhipicephalus appendiculatus]